jgi:protein-L-isoaspartate(D-aspartate) O-methyltransferase
MARRSSRCWQSVFSSWYDALRAATVGVAAAASVTPGAGRDPRVPVRELPVHVDSRGGIQNQSHGERRLLMIEEQIRRRGVTDPGVLAAMGKVPRERFVLPDEISRAYADSPLPIGYGQTISQPYIVAYMTETLGVSASHRVLEIGTGSGYQAAILGELAREVYTIEIVPELADRAGATLQSLGYANVHVRSGDGYAGWPEHAPFDRILVTAAPEEIPRPLLEQLAPGGRLVAPVGAQGDTQWVTVVDKSDAGLVERRTIPVQFVPFTRGPRG